jgi:hypothetical protein
MTSPELTGGAGFTYEDTVAAYYLAALVCGTTAAGLSARVVHRVAQQQASFGQPLDDVIVDAIDLSNGAPMRLALQVKRSLTISDSESNGDFREVIQHSFETLQKPDFRAFADRVGAATGTISDAAYRNFQTICEWARASQSVSSFTQRFAAGGNASDTHRSLLEAVRSAAGIDGSGSLSDEDLHNLLRHFVLIKFDFLHDGSVNEAEIISALQRGLAPIHASRAGDLWQQLRQIARLGSARSAEFTHASVLRDLGSFQFIGTPALASDLNVLRESTQGWLAQQADGIGGKHVDRVSLMQELEKQVGEHRLTLIKGLPGTGKTVILKNFLAKHVASGTTFLLTANRISGHSWTEHARSIGLTSVGIGPLLVEVSATGHPILFIDGLDRISTEHRPVVTEILGQILTNEGLANWKIVATARDAGIEPLRNWVPAQLLADRGVGYVSVGNLSKEEASALVDELPALRPLLKGDDRVGELARRPFFASVMARGLSNAGYPSDFAPRSEVDLLSAWWQRGGYDAQSPQALPRQRGLIEIAGCSAPDLGRNVRIRDLTDPTQSVLPALEEDSVVQQVRLGHTAQFSHDIFFEWSFFHLLVDHDEDWIGILTEVGEPPALGRVVELLSQATYTDFAKWANTLKVLEQSAVRPQWLRAWIVAPVFSPDFGSQADSYEAVLAENDHRLLGKLLVWMQAEKTTPNPMVLTGQYGTSDLSSRERLRIADALGWPSDITAWQRLIFWIIERIDTVPENLLADVVRIFETWQVLASDMANPTSAEIIKQCATWLHAIEDAEEAYRTRHRRPETRQDNGKPPQPRAPKGLASELRALVLRAARAYPDLASNYLTRIASIDRLDSATFNQVMEYAPILAKLQPSLLAQVARRTLLLELPEDSIVRWRSEEAERARRREEIRAIPEDQRTRFHDLELGSPMFPNSFSSHDWDRLSIGADHQGYFPASPLREPFCSLLREAPSEGLSLIRDMANHATTAWLQLHRHDWEHRERTPLPLMVSFPWGDQEFWGTGRQYKWFRGHGGPQALECALMALERWVLEQLDSGRSAEDLVSDLLKDQQSVSVLGIASHIAARIQKASAWALALVCSQRLWRMELRRHVEESQFKSASLIGFDLTKPNAAHRKAIIDSSSLASRNHEIRDLVPLFVLGEHEGFRNTCRDALIGFKERLDFEYVEEADDAEHVAELSRTAEIWSEWGRAENYVTTTVPGRDDVVGIELRNPHHSSPEVQDAMDKHARLSREWGLWAWVEKCFESNSWTDGFSPDEAVQSARELRSTMIQPETGKLDMGMGLAHGAIAGTAAAICCFARTSGHEEWADSILSSYDDEIENREHIYAKSILPWHPKIFVAHALTARIREGRARPTDRIDLYRLVAHPLEAVSLPAIQGVAACWAKDAQYAWCGLNLGLRLATYTRDPNPYSRDEEAKRIAEQTRVDNVVAETYSEYEAKNAFPSLVQPRPSWAQSPTGQGDPDAGGDGSWFHTNDYWLGDYAGGILRLLPVAEVMSSAAKDKYVSALEEFVAWTLDTINPAWRGSSRRDRDFDTTDLYQWEHELGHLIADASLHLDTYDVRTRLLSRILEQPDEIATRLLQRFVTTLICAGVMDASEVRAGTLELLDTALDRVLAHRDLRRTEYSDDRLSGFDLPSIIKAFLFVKVEHASSSARFANGAWGDLHVVMPIIDKLMRNAGWSSHVTREYLTLCERADASYPTDTFAEQILAQLQDGRFPVRWAGTLIPASIAGLVQAHADRLHPLSNELAQKLLRILDALVDLGDRRSAALQTSELFRGVRLVASSSAKSAA